MSIHLPTPDQFWIDPATQPTSDNWNSWKSTFFDYISFLPVFNASVKLTEAHVLKLLRLYLGSEGRRIFDALNLQQKPTLKEAIDSLDKHWSARTNTYVARYKFSQLRQVSGETLERFIARIVCAARSCDYNMIEPKKVEEVLMIQQLISGG